MPRHPRYSIELDDERRSLWQSAADIGAPDRERNLAAWILPILDAAAQAQLAGKDPLRLLTGKRR